MTKLNLQGGTPAFDGAGNSILTKIYCVLLVMVTLAKGQASTTWRQNMIQQHCQSVVRDAPLIRPVLSRPGSVAG